MIISITPAIWTVCGLDTVCWRLLFVCLFHLAQHSRRPIQQLPVWLFTDCPYALLTPPLPSRHRCISNSLSAYHLANSWHCLELSLGSTKLSAFSATVPRFVGESYNLALTSLYIPDKCHKWGLDACYSVTVSRKLPCTLKVIFHPCPNSLYSLSTFTTAPWSSDRPSRLTLDIWNLNLRLLCGWLPNLADNGLKTVS